MRTVQWKGIPKSEQVLLEVSKWNDLRDGPTPRYLPKLKGCRHKILENKVEFKLDNEGERDQESKVSLYGCFMLFHVAEICSEYDNEQGVL